MQKAFLIAAICLFINNAFSQSILDTITVHFDSDQSIVIDQEVLSELESKVISNIRLYAYTDSLGSTAYNKKLAERRGEAVRNQLAHLTSNIDVIAIGESQKYNDLASNRRVAIVIVGENSPVIPQPIIEEVITLNVEFLPEQDVIRADSYDEVLEFLELIKTKTYSAIELHGHVCCAPGQDLSERRAKAVAKELEWSGVDPKIIKTFGYSNTQPLFPETSETNKRKNRRVEVLLIK